MKVTLLLLTALLPTAGFASTEAMLDLTEHWIGWFSLAVFVIAYLLVMAEEFTELRKSKPVIIAAGVIWVSIGMIYADNGMDHSVEVAVRHNLLEYAELALFLLVAMTYINTMEERQVFAALRSWLVGTGYSFRTLFWLTGILAFFISPIADNLTTALLMCAVILAVGRGNEKFILLSCINVVVAANAGGAFSPFGDITTLMVWQKGIVDFWTFFDLFIPSAVNFLVPAFIMQFYVPVVIPPKSRERTAMKRGAIWVIGLFVMTIATAVSVHHFVHLPPVIGMLTGLGYLQLFGFYLKKTTHKDNHTEADLNADREHIGTPLTFDVFSPVAKAEWDTLFFFYGVILCVGGLGFIGYLSLISEVMYADWGATYANIAVGVLSAIVDNIPVMFAVLSMTPDMSTGQWLLVTLTAGVGGSLLSIGSAAGVALMGQARGQYTFFGHLKWMPVVAAGYIASILAHMWFNQSYFM